MKLSELIPSEEIQSKHAPEEIEICGVCDHTKDLKEGMLFIAKKGERTDTALLLDEIEEKKAAAILLAKGTKLPRATILPCFFAENLTLTEIKIWERYYGNPAASLRIFGVTGTNGKTGTAEFLAHILNASGIPTAYIGTLGAHLGDLSLQEKGDTMTTPPPSTLYKHLHQALAHGARAVVIEVSSHAAVQGRVSRLHFEELLFTNLTEDHLDYHGTMEAYYAAKRSLFDRADLAIINKDNDYGERLLSELCIPRKSIGIIESADYTVSDLHENGYESTQYTCVTPFGEFSVFYPFFGGFQVYNTLLAIVAAIHAGICPEEIRRSLLSLSPPKGRLEVLPIQKDFTVIIDYAHTPDAMEAAIKAVKRKARGRLYVLFGAGGDREREKRPLMGQIALSHAAHVFITEDNPRTEDPQRIINDILMGANGKSNYSVISDRKTAIQAALSILSKGDTLLLLGKGHEEYLIKGEKTVPFFERDIVYQYLKEKEKG